MNLSHQSSRKSTTPDNSKKTSPQNHAPAAPDAELSEMLQRASTSPQLLSRGDVLHLQRTIGNQAVRRLLQRDSQEPSHPVYGSASAESIQREEEAGEQEEEQQGGNLSIQEEKEILQAKRIVQRQPDFAHKYIQRAWTGRRQLGKGGLNTLLGKPWVLRKKGNFLRLGGYHEHIFFEDGGTPADIGHMGKQGLGQDTGREGEYARVRKGLDDTKMRQAVEANKSIGEPDKYDLLSNNCQDFVHKVLQTYDDL